MSYLNGGFQQVVRMNCQKLRRVLKQKGTVDPRTFCEAIFPGVSRTFAINVRKLPKKLRFQILVSYLLCRIADTVEDDSGLSPTVKGELLEEYTSLLKDPEWKKNANLFIAKCQPMDETKNEVLLLHNSHYVLECFYGFPPEIREHIGPWVAELALGMKKYALRKSEENHEVTFLTSIEDLEEYCYYVAGTVGHLLTGLFHHYYPRISDSCYQKLEKRASSFGIGLQLTNIIKDSIVDYQRGWCYLPGDLLNRLNLSGEAFLDIHRREDAQALMSQMIAKAQRHLDDALEYSLLLPRRLWKVRIFCFLPLFMAIKTLAKSMKNEQLFDPKDPVKITRKEVAEILRYTFFNIWSNRRMLRWYHNVRQSLKTRLAVLEQT